MKKVFILLLATCAVAGAQNLPHKGPVTLNLDGLPPVVAHPQPFPHAHKVPSHIEDSVGLDGDGNVKVPLPVIQHETLAPVQHERLVKPRPLIPAINSLWEYNGSTMGLTINGNVREFRYLNVRPGLQQIGVSPGVLQFHGVANGSSTTGIAFVFSQHCGRIPYKVAGIVSFDHSEVAMVGMRPYTDSITCRIVKVQPETSVYHIIEGR